MSDNEPEGIENATHPFAKLTWMFVFLFKNVKYG
jgi:hypothetical protein